MSRESVASLRHGSRSRASSSTSKGRCNSSSTWRRRLPACRTDRATPARTDARNLDKHRDRPARTRSRRLRRPLIHIKPLAGRPLGLAQCASPSFGHQHGASSAFGTHLQLTEQRAGPCEPKHVALLLVEVHRFLDHHHRFVSRAEKEDFGALPSALALEPRSSPTGRSSQPSAAVATSRSTPRTTTARSWNGWGSSP
jgi:hypothetical protein